jgi:hypothetical protein
MIRSIGYTKKIVKGDVITDQVTQRLIISKRDLLSLLERTYTIVVILFDR